MTDGPIYYRGTVPGDTRRIKTGNDSWDSHLFVADNPKSASMYGQQVQKVILHPDSKILREGTRDFVKVAGKWRKGESLLDFSHRVAQQAKNAGYDAVHFKRQTDVGTAIINRNIVQRMEPFDHRSMAQQQALKKATEVSAQKRKGHPILGRHSK